MQLDHRAPGPPCPRTCLVLVPLQHAHVVQWPEAGGADECRPLRVDRPVQPQPEYEEGRRGPKGTDLVAPGRVAQVGGAGDTTAQSPSTSAARTTASTASSGPLSTSTGTGDRDARPARDAAPAAPDLRPVDGRAGADVDAQPGEVPGERIPDRLRERPSRYVEEQALAGPEEVQVEHRRQLGRGQLARVGEEAAREHRERQVARGGRKPDPVEERRPRPRRPAVRTRRAPRRRAAAAPPARPAASTSRGRNVGLRRGERQRAPRRGPREAGEAVPQRRPRAAADSRRRRTSRSRCGIDPRAAERAGCSTAGRTRGSRGVIVAVLPSREPWSASRTAGRRAAARARAGRPGRRARPAPTAAATPAMPPPTTATPVRSGPRPDACGGRPGRASSARPAGRVPAASGGRVTRAVRVRVGSGVSAVGARSGRGRGTCARCRAASPTSARRVRR